VYLVKADNQVSSRRHTVRKAAVISTTAIKLYNYCLVTKPLFINETLMAQI